MVVFSLSTGGYIDNIETQKALALTVLPNTRNKTIREIRYVIVDIENIVNFSSLKEDIRIT